MAGYLLFGKKLAVHKLVNRKYIGALQRNDLFTFTDNLL